MEMKEFQPKRKKKKKKIWLIMIVKVVGNKSNQEKLLPTCANVVADCQNSVCRRRNTRLFVSSQSLQHWLEWAAPPSLGPVIHRTTESSGLEKISKVFKLKNEHSTTKSPSATSAYLPHLCTGHKTSLVLHSCRDQFRQQNLTGTAI